MVGREEEGVTVRTGLWLRRNLGQLIRQMFSLESFAYSSTQYLLAYRAPYDER
jgi:hypothetical protein